MSGVVDVIKEFLLNIFVLPEIVTVLIALFPIVEVRGAIPVAMSYGIPPFFAWLYSFLGASLIVPLLLLIFLPILNWLRRTKVFKKIGEVLYEKFEKGARGLNAPKDTSEQKNELSAEEKSAMDAAAAKKRERNMMLGLFVFVAIPFPGTGVWAGSAVAAICGLKYHKALISVIAGNLAASLIVVFLCAVFANFVDWIILGIFIVALLIALFLILKIILPKKNPKKDKNNLN